MSTDPAPKFVDFSAKLEGEPIQAKMGGVTFEIRSSLTYVMLHSARSFARDAKALEAGASIDVYSQTRYVGFVLGAVMQSVGALESEIHEICAYGPGHHLGSNGVDTAGRELLAPLADLIDGAEVLERYRIVLKLLKKAPLDSSTQVWEHAKLGLVPQKRTPRNLVV